MGFTQPATLRTNGKKTVVPQNQLPLPHIGNPVMRAAPKKQPTHKEYRGYYSNWTHQIGNTIEKLICQEINFLMASHILWLSDPWNSMFYLPLLPKRKPSDRQLGPYIWLGLTPHPILPHPKMKTPHEQSGIQI